MKNKKNMVIIVSLILMIFLGLSKNMYFADVGDFETYSYDSGSYSDSRDYSHNDSRISNDYSSDDRDIDRDRDRDRDYTPSNGVKLEVLAISVVTIIVLVLIGIGIAKLIIGKKVYSGKKIKSNKKDSK